MNDNKKQRAGSRWLVFMGLALAAMGSVFTVVLWVSWQRAEATRTWTATPCKILSSQVLTEQATPHSPSKYRVLVRYQYEFNGKRFTNERIRRSDGPKSNREDADALREEFTHGQQTTCWVKPDEPSYAVLKHETRAALYTLWFPLLFVIGGLRMAWAAVRKS